MTANVAAIARGIVDGLLGGGRRSRRVSAGRSGRRAARDPGGAGPRRVQADAKTQASQAAGASEHREQRGRSQPGVEVPLHVDKYPAAAVVRVRLTVSGAGRPP